MFQSSYYSSLEVEVQQNKNAMAYYETTQEGIEANIIASYISI